MSEYWKSTPKYWCKHCSVYVRDTKLERVNHESTGKHQGAVKRALRDLHRGHEQAERDKERAKRELDRLNGVVGSSSSSSGYAAPPAPRASRQEQLEQLAGMGVNIPQEMRSDLALAGDWQVTTTRVVPDPEDAQDSKDGAGQQAIGVRKRELDKTEEELEEEDAVKGLFKKQRRWGRDIRTAAGEGEGDEELDALLSGGLGAVKKEVKKEVKEEEANKVKQEEGAETQPSEPPVKEEEGEDDTATGDQSKETSISQIPDVKAEEGQTADAPAVVFKKRKPKNVRQR